MLRDTFKTNFLFGKNVDFLRVGFEDPFLSQLPQKTTLAPKVVKTDSKIIISLLA